MSNFETLLTAWLQGGDIPDDFTPASKQEAYLLAIVQGVDDDVDPKSRSDVLLDAIATKYAGYAAGLEDLQDVTGVTEHHVPGANTPETIAAYIRLLNTIALQDLTAKGATGVSDNTTDILAAYKDLPSGGGGFEASVAYDDKTDKLFLTNNFYTICRTVMFGSTNANNTTAGQTDGAGVVGNNPVLGKLVDTSGATVQYINGGNGFQFMLTRYVFNGASNNNTFTAVATGTGTTGPAKTDFSLTTINYSDTVLAPQKETLDDFSGTMVIAATIGNTSGADRVINEIGVTSGVLGGGSWDYRKILIARAVLSSPVTLANGESKVFTVRIGLPTPE